MTFKSFLILLDAQKKNPFPIVLFGPEYERCTVLLQSFTFPVSPLKQHRAINQERSQLQRIRGTRRDTGENGARNTSNALFLFSLSSAEKFQLSILCLWMVCFPITVLDTVGFAHISCSSSRRSEFLVSTCWTSALSPASRLRRGRGNVKSHCTQTRRPALLPRETLTSFAVFPSESERAVAAEGAPQVHAGPPVQTRVIVAEVSFGGAPWYIGRVTGWSLHLICSTSLFHRHCRVGG